MFHGVNLTIDLIVGEGKEIQEGSDPKCYSPPSLVEGVEDSAHADGGYIQRPPSRVVHITTFSKDSLDTLGIIEDRSKKFADFFVVIFGSYLHRRQKPLYLATC